MEICVDFLSFLGRDMSLKILMCLEDPSDLLRVSSVSRSWRHFVIENGLCKQLCLKMFPYLQRVDRVVETSSCGVNTLSVVGCSRLLDWEILKREHRAYAFLARSFKLFSLVPCISYAISASSTDNFPEESISNTLERRDRVARRPSYWSSKGQSNPVVPETLVYKLVADICVITEISIQPFQAYFQSGLPIYSAQSVRFRMGHPKAPIDDPMGEPFDSCDDDKFIWTYTSPEFPMDQENCLQKFILPEPVLCIGGILQIDLLGRVQRQEMDGLFYICVSHVQVIGQALSPSFGVEILEPSGKFVLKALSYTPTLPQDQPPSGPLSNGGHLQEHTVALGQVVNLLGVVEDNWHDDDEESD